jgi:hypothetical protein
MGRSATGPLAQADGTAPRVQTRDRCSGGHEQLEKTVAGSPERRSAIGRTCERSGWESAIGTHRRGITLSRFCYRRRKTLAPQRPRKLPKLNVAGSTPVARSSKESSCRGFRDPTRIARATSSLRRFLCHRRRPRRVAVMVARVEQARSSRISRAVSGRSTAWNS